MNDNESSRVAPEDGAMAAHKPAPDTPIHDAISPEGWTLERARDFLADGGYDVGVFALILANTGIPVPPTVIGRVRKGLGRLIDSSFDLATSKIDRVKRRQDFEQDVQQKAVAVVASGGAAQIANNSAASDMAMAMVRDFSRKWENQAAVAKAAFEELEANPPTEDATPDAELNEDWLNYFADVAAQKSSEEMRTLMGRILAGEIRQPGSFSPLTIHALGTLTQEAARKFEDICSLAVAIHDRPVLPLQAYPKMLGEGVPELGIGYLDVLMLQSQFLISQATGSGFNVEVDYAIPLTCLGNGREFVFQAKEKQRRVSVLLFTPTGTEILSLLKPATHPDLESKLTEAFPTDQWNRLPVP